jgi:heme/copper-type cytochrome/quinol oxidase subunit 3
MKNLISYGIAFLLAAFGLLTLFLSASVIFDLFGIRAKEGNYVLFIVWANFISSLIYLVASYGFIKNKKWTTNILGISTLILINAFIGFTVYIYADGVHETKTVGAMIFRITVTLIFVAFAYFTINKKKQINTN